jgi:outer membrane biosynthesis protein TonB
MTSLLPPSRALSHQLASRASQLGGVPRSCPNPWSRVVYNNAGLLSTLLQSNASTPLLSQLLCRSYATKPGKPKAHTGRVAASKRKPAVARSDAAAGVPKKAPAKKAPAKTKRATTTRKPAAKKPGRKAKSKPKPKPAPKRKVLTERQKAAREKKQASEKKKDLRKIALLDAPKQLPSTAYIVLSVESSGKGMSVTQHAKDVSAQYKTLSPEEMEVHAIPAPKFVPA